MQWGGDVDFLLEVSAKKGELTDSLKNRPTLADGLELPWEAFAILSASRSHSLRFGKNETQHIVPEAIIFSEILSFLNNAGINEVEQRLRFSRYIQKMDAEFLDAATAKVR